MVGISRGRFSSLPIAQETGVPFADLLLGEVGVRLEHLNGFGGKDGPKSSRMDHTASKASRSNTYGSVLAECLLPMITSEFGL